MYRKLNGIRQWADSVPDGEITVSEQAAELFEIFYHEYYLRCQQPGIIPTLIVRIQDFIWKIGLLYAANDHSQIISKEHLEAAIAMGNYLEASVAEVFANFEISYNKTQETKLLEFLRSAGRPVPEREVYRKLKMSARELEKLVIPLVKIGLIKNSYIRTEQGRQIRTYEAI